MRSILYLLSLGAASGALGASVERGNIASEPILPSQDPWYTAPDDYESATPGTVLGIRTAPGNLTSLVGNSSVAAWNIKYRTTNSADEPSWAVTTLFRPQKLSYSSLSKQSTVVTYQIAYNSANVDMVPSIGLYWTFAQDYPEHGVRSETSLIRELLSRGWMVSVPDYWGPDAAFGASVQGGHATLDGVRAVESLQNITHSPRTNNFIWGYSGGSMGTLAAAELQPEYAPDLVLSGTVIGGVVDDFSKSFETLNETPNSPAMISALIGITTQYPEAKEYLESRLVPETKEEFLSVKKIHILETVAKFANKNIYPYFIGGQDDLHSPIMTSLYEKQFNLANIGTPSETPVFVYKAVQDAGVRIELTDAVVQEWCKQGLDVQYERNVVGGHQEEIENGKPRVLEWVLGQLSSGAREECIIQTVNYTAPALP